MIFVAGWPALNRIMVGIDMTWKAAAVCWFSSMFSLTTRRPFSWPICSRTGETARHGPHQGAQKSTSTGSAASMTSAWKLASVTFCRSDMSGSQDGLELRLEAALGVGADDRLHRLAGLEEDHRGDRHDAELRGGLLVVVHVELHDAQVVALGGELLEHRGDDAARAAPGRPEVDEDR